MATNFIDISDLEKKVDNEDARSEIESDEVSPDEYLSAEEFVNKIVKPIKQLQDEAKQAVKSVTFNGNKQLPDTDGNVDITYVSGGDTYSATLFLKEDANTPIITIKDLVCHICYSSVRISSLGMTNAGIVGNLLVERSVDNGATWVEVTTLPVSSQNYTQDESKRTYEELNLASFLRSGKQMLRLSASFNYIDPSTKRDTVAYSDNIILSSVTLTDLSAEFAGTYQSPINGETSTRLQLAYRLSGTIARKLHVKITAVGRPQFSAVYDIPADQFTNNLSTWTQDLVDTTGVYGLLAHGVKTIEVWLTCSDGTTNDAIESEHVVNQILVLNKTTQGADFNKPYVLIENVITKATNYVAVDNVLDYAVWKSKSADDPYTPSDESIDLAFILSDYGDNGINWHEEYLRLETQASIGEIQHLPATIEIENSVDNTLYTYLHVFSGDTDILYQSSGINSYSITIDNTEKFAPTSGADFFLNPKNRNNSEANPFRIINAARNSTDPDYIIPSRFTKMGAVNDLWVTSETDKQKVMRVTAGKKVEIEYDWLKAFKNTPYANVTLELDFKVKNMTFKGENESIIEMCEQLSDRFIGLKMTPIEGIVYTNNHQSLDSQNFSWAEDERTHIAINIVSALRSTTENNNTLAVCRVFINGVINREFFFNLESGEWYNNGSKIVIGNSACDIDVYSIRVYNNELSSSNILQDYISTLPTSEQKLQVRKENSLLGSNGTISIDKVNTLGKNTLVWHGIQPYHEDATKKAGYWEIKVFNEDGTLDPDRSGTLCKASYLAYLNDNKVVCLFATRQGSTANTYFWSNLQTKMKDVEYIIRVLVKNLHSECGVKIDSASTDGEDAANPIYFNDTRITYAEYQALSESDKQNVSVDVVDGWIDGNGMYRGNQYRINQSCLYGQKLVLKINYASSMQSHLMGGCRLYNDLHTAICGKNELQLVNSKARVAKYQEPFYFFVQEEEGGEAVYQGPGTFGPGKMDDKTWGYSKASFPHFMMIEGSDNNFALTDFRVPWQTSRIGYEVDDSDASAPEVAGWTYNGQTNFDFDKGTTSKVTIEGFAAKVKVPSDPIAIQKLKDFVNFCYKHNVGIRCYTGSWDSFLADPSKNASGDTTSFWWCISGANAGRLIRYDAIDKAWVNAGWNEETEETVERNLFAEFPNVYNEFAGQYQEMNNGFIRAIADKAKETIDTIIDTDSLRFHYAFVNTFLAGTDNCSKNTYYVLVKKGDNYVWQLHQDDVDTIFKTDNSGFQSKPYYISRYYPTAEGSTISLYEGGANALFNLCEAMYIESGEIRTMMRAIFRTMADICDKKYGNGVWGCLNQYFFSTQRYFSATAYNEAARIRYEYPATIRTTSYPNGFVSDRNVAPITQSMGDQLQSEIQYMKRRLILYASYAEYGQAAVDSSGSIGIEDTSAVFGVQATPYLNGNSSNFWLNVTPAQYIYPTGRVGQSTKALRKRVKPGETVEFKISDEPIKGDTAAALMMANYYSSFGNLGDLSAKAIGETLTITGTRLEDITIEPTDEDEFRPDKLEIAAPLIRKLSMKGANRIGGTLDLRECTRLESIDLRGCNGFVSDGKVEQGITTVRLPETEQLETIHFNGRLEGIELKNLPSLETCDIEGYTNLTSLIVSEDIKALDTATVIRNLYNAKNSGIEGTKEIETLSFKGINWTGIYVALLDWLTTINNLTLTGEITIVEEYTTRPSVTFDKKIAYIQKWGNVDDASSENYQGLLLHYMKRDVTSISIKGEAYTHESNKNYPYVAVPPNQYVNNFQAIRWSWQWGVDAVKAAQFQLNENTGDLFVSNISPLVDTIILTCKVYVSSTEIISATKEIGLYDRKAHLGDYVFADGSFSDSQDENKTVVAVCCWVAPEEDNEQLLFQNDDVQRRLCVATTNAGCSASGGTSYTSFSFMPFRSNTDAANGLYKEDKSFFLFNDGIEIYDVSNIVNLSTSGLSAVTGDESNAGATNYIRTSNFRDEESTEGILNNGFKVHNEYYVMGDGIAYNSGGSSTMTPNAAKSARTLTTELAALAGSSYKAGDVVNSGYAKTLKYIAWRNRIIEDSEATPLIEAAHCSIPQEGSGFTEIQSLANNMENMDNYMRSAGETHYAKWRQLFCPAPSAAYAFEPTQKLMEGEVLSEKLKKHNWFLPPMGILGQLYWYHYIGTGDDRNIFKKAIAEGKFTAFSGTNYWSSTENNSFFVWYVNFGSGGINGSGKYHSLVVRPVCAF